MDGDGQVPGIPQAMVNAQGFLSEKAFLALDPVDGTTNFACGGPDWGVSGTEDCQNWSSPFDVETRILGSSEAASRALPAFVELLFGIWCTCREEKHSRLTAVVFASKPQVSCGITL